MEQNIGGQKLYQHLKTHGRAEIDGQAINMDNAEIWLTNPYGVDVGFYTNSAEGCAGILERTSADDHEEEWDTLQCSHSELKATDAHHGTGAVA